MATNNDLAGLPLSVLRYTKAAAEHGSFSAAARLCRVTQPTVSNAVASLEERLGGLLFARTPRQISLTPFGERMLPFIRGVIEGSELLLAEAARFQNPPSKLLRIGFCALFSSQLLYRAVEPFRLQYPNVEIVYKECRVGDMHDRLDSHTIDVVVSPFVTKSARRRTLPLMSEPLHFLPRGGMTPELSLRRRAGVTLETVAEELLVFSNGDCGLAPATRQLFRKRQLSPREYPGEALSYSVLQEWSELGLGGAILPASRITGGPSQFPQIMDGDSVIEITHSIVWNRDATRQSHVQAFLKYLKARLSKPGSGPRTSAGLASLSHATVLRAGAAPRRA